MNYVDIFTKLDSIARPLLFKIPGLTVSRVYSPGRKAFIKMLTNQKVRKINLPESSRVRLWDIDYNCKLFNAAGMFKKAEGYYAIANQGAGAFLAGTTTSKPRTGNSKFGITHPFFPMPKSATALNWMGLPNEGHETVAKRISKLEKQPFCPIGISIGADPDLTGQEAIDGILKGLELYERAGVDFVEINESCPNVEHEHGELNECGIDMSLITRLEVIKDKFLKHRNRNLPVILKFSNDTEITQVRPLIELLIDMGFDGVNFGNTSTQYENLMKFIDKSEIAKYKKFYQNIGGGISGRAVKELSANLCTEAAKAIKEANPSQEFHLIRTGGIEDKMDLKVSDDIGVSINQWFSGYFDMFAQEGNKTYFSIS